jgi:hypothetical protein
LELRRGFENIWYGVLAEIPWKSIRDIGKREGNVVGQIFGQGGGQSGERGAQAASAARDSTIGENENGSDIIEAFLNFCGNILLVDPGLLKTSIIDQPWHVEDTNLGKKLCLLTTLKYARTYHYAVFASEFVKAGIAGLTVIGWTTLLIGVIEDVVVNVVTSKDIGDEFHEWGLADTSFSNQNDCVERRRVVVWCLDDPVPERFYVAGR